MGASYREVSNNAMARRSYLQPFFMSLAVVCAMFAPVAARAADSPAPSPTASAQASSYPPVAVPAGPRSQSASEMLTSARADADRGLNDSAAQKLRGAAVLEPRNLEIQRLLGDVEYRLEHYKAAEAAYQAVLAIDPNNRDVYNRLGGVYAAEDRFNDAISAFRKSLPSREGFANLVQAYADEGKLGELEAEYKLEETRDPYEPANHYNLAVIYKAEQKYDGAIAQAGYALDRNARFTDAHNILGTVYGEQGRYEDAIAQYKMAIGIDGRYAFGWLNWGVELINEGNSAAAVEKIKHSISLDPQLALAYENLGVAYDHLDDFTGAVEQYQHTISLDPHDRNIYVNLGALYYNHNQYNLAEAAFIKGLALQSKNALLHLGLGVTYASQKKYQLADVQLKEALAENPKDSLAAAKLAEVESHLTR